MNDCVRVCECVCRGGDSERSDEWDTKIVERMTKRVIQSTVGVIQYYSSVCVSVHPHLYARSALLVGAGEVDVAVWYSVRGSDVPW